MRIYIGDLFCKFASITAAKMDDPSDMVNEPQAEYKAIKPQKTITFYNSFEEMEADRWRYLASTTHEQRLAFLEERRKLKFHEYLLPDGTWPPLKRTLTIIKNGR